MHGGGRSGEDALDSTCMGEEDEQAGRGRRIWGNSVLILGTCSGGVYDVRGDVGLASYSCNSGIDARAEESSQICDIFPAEGGSSS